MAFSFLYISVFVFSPASICFGTTESKKTGTILEANNREQCEDSDRFGSPGNYSKTPELFLFLFV